MTPLTYLTVFYQAACRRYHMYSVDSRQKEVVNEDSCVLRLDDRNADEEVENLSESLSGESSHVEKRHMSCSCSECFLHVPQYSQQAYLQIVRVRFQLFVLVFCSPLVGGSIMHYPLSVCPVVVVVSGMQLRIA